MSYSILNIVKLKDISIGKGEYGIGASSVEYSSHLPTYLRITDINDDGNIKFDSLKSVDDNKSSSYYLMENDIVFARTGASTGRAYFHETKNGRLVYAGFLIKFSLDPTKINPKYMKYYALSDQYKGWVTAFTGGSTRGNINAKTYGDMEMPIPDRKQQDYLVQLLSSLDDKIELNNKINKNLEEMAQVLYRQWFIDFEFPNEDGELYKSSDGEMIESELGLVPKGWECINVNDIARFRMGSPYKSSLFSDKIGTPVIRIRDLKTMVPKKHTTEVHSREVIINPSDILVGMDAEFTPTIWTGEKGYLNQRVFKVETLTNEISKYYIFDLIKPHMNFFEKTKSGTTVIHLGKSDLNSIKVIQPIQRVLEDYSRLISPIYDSVVKNSLENNKLSMLRDTLLPKLMSGEIRVPFKE